MTTTDETDAEGAVPAEPPGPTDAPVDPVPGGPGVLCHTDGTAEGTGGCEVFGGARPTGLTPSPSGLFFFVYSETIDGFEPRLRPLGDGPSRRLLGTTPDGLPLEPMRPPTPFGSGILFFGYDEFHGLEPWVSDGTPEGTRPLGDVVPGAGSPGWAAVATLGTQAFLFGSGRIWRTAGTSAGPFTVAGDPPAGIPSGELAGLGDRLLYVGTTFETGRELWVLPVDIRLSAHTNKLQFRPRAYSYIGAVPLIDLVDKPIADWDHIAKRSFDLVLVSLDREGFDGLRLCSQLRSLERTRQVPLIMVAEAHDRARIVRGLDFGVHDYLLRPVDRRIAHGVQPDYR